MSKKLYIFFLLLLFSISLFSTNYNLNLEVLKVKPLKLSFNANDNAINFRISIEEKEPFLKEQNLFFKKIKVKTGEQNFSFFLDIPTYNSEMGIGFKYNTYNSILLGIIKYDYFNTFNFKSNNYYIFQGFNTYFSIPTITIGSFNNFFLNINSEVYSFSRIGFKLQRFLELPLFLNFGRNFETGIQVLSFDKYYSTGIFGGISYNKNKIYVLGDISTKLNLLKKDFIVGFGLMYNEEYKYRIYLISDTKNFPIYIYFNECGGGIFAEL
ncbi:hypothetical protein OSSY52_21060 [Tepiditoga spiralis]|uniref:Uncharacterized protein n=1 Tax=Tepiditoga spiralis TaxID=2108365 RepID=A0A7G1G6Y8_9BACT|nr:hypothetical protein [Tepiditoga spiralis]BBE31965.1 hypothetical protein OSSY52_21060 [Tepiditoga spiralis]